MIAWNTAKSATAHLGRLTECFTSSPSPTAMECCDRSAFAETLEERRNAMALDNPPKDPLAIYEDKPVDDPDNPEWTEEDHGRAKPMPETILDSFPKMR